ncbi:hypothetical protein M5K25_018534 [Dendrobium thyrsiflorum]|uniref:Uncharacterized protein n=1 Tax=Dendrobium thyrsiflorum TaxID=117978 RepID=A0ABD0UQS3_DENTH
MEEQMRLYIRLAMEDSGFHLHTSMDNNMYNLINVTRFPSFDTSARMRFGVEGKILDFPNQRNDRLKGSSIFNLAPLNHLPFRLLVRSMITTFVSHRGREAYYTGGYDPVVPPVAPPPDRIGATDALIRLSLLLRQSFMLRSGLCSPQVPRKGKGETEEIKQEEDDGVVEEESRRIEEEEKEREEKKRKEVPAVRGGVCKRAKRSGQPGWIWRVALARPWPGPANEKQRDGLRRRNRVSSSLASAEFRCREQEAARRTGSRAWLGSRGVWRRRT